jgi:hypothetical protein
MKMSFPTQDEIKEWLSYDAASGHFTWIKKRTNSRVTVGGRAGSLHLTGYVVITLGGRTNAIGAHRLAWAYVHGSIPDGMEIDHIDRDRSNNVLSNLRLATPAEQSRNRGAFTTSRSGIKGVNYHQRDKYWRAQICVNRRTIWLGSFKTADEARMAYQEAAARHFGQYASSF